MNSKTGPIKRKIKTKVKLEKRAEQIADKSKKGVASKSGKTSSNKQAKKGKSEMPTKRLQQAPIDESELIASGFLRKSSVNSLQNKRDANVNMQASWQQSLKAAELATVQKNQAAAYTQARTLAQQHDDE